MAFDPAQFEKLGAFYLGRPIDPTSAQPLDAPLLYDSRHLVTHAVCLGMTGSGKTGLCLSLLEEAAIDGVPAIIIDPKGDLTNLALTFPDLLPEDFRPWINEEDAARKNQTPEAYASAQAQMWRDGLAAWGQGPARIRLLRESADIVIFTPGGSGGTPVDIMGSFAAPDCSDPEVRGERAQTAAASLLGLLKSNADPVQSREGILLAAILDAAWKQGRDLDLESLIGEIQRPPFEKVGVLDLETFFPAKDRFSLVMGLNNILASPAFAAWRHGEPLDIARCLRAPSGKPRLAIFSIAHLGDDERMFFVSLLLNEVLAWTRAQSGTTSLRAILYMDEIFGYLPPSANPPSKRPILTLLKQARAFGVGVVLATQNPVDLDYKALSNAGTWFIGRLQTERDRARVLDGLQGAAAGAAFDRRAMERLLGGLGNRRFLLNNVNEEAPIVFETRWAMSYLRGPLTRDQLRAVAAAGLTTPPSQPMAQVADPHHPQPATADAPLSNPPSTPPPSSSRASSASRPPLPPGIPEVFLPIGTAANPASHYTPALLAMAQVSYSSARMGIDHSETVQLLCPLPETFACPAWQAGEPQEFLPEELSPSPAPEASFAPLPEAASQPKNFTEWQKSFRTWLATSRPLELFASDTPKLISHPHETRSEFAARVSQACRESRDAATDALRKKYAPRSAALEARIARAEATVQQHKERAAQARLQSMISVGSGILGAFLGKKAISSANVGRATTAARGIGRAMKGGSSIQAAEQNLESLRAQLADLEAEFAAEAAALSHREASIEPHPLKPSRAGIASLRILLAWVPS